MSSEGQKSKPRPSSAKSIFGILINVCVPTLFPSCPRFVKDRSRMLRSYSDDLRWRAISRSRIENREVSFLLQLSPTILP